MAESHRTLPPDGGTQPPTTQNEPRRSARNHSARPENPRQSKSKGRGQDASGSGQGGGEAEERNMEDRFIVLTDTLLMAIFLTHDCPRWLESLLFPFQIRNKYWPMTQDN